MGWYIRTFRKSFWKSNPLCHWCGIKTELNVPDGTPNQATIDHLYPRGDSRRGSGPGLDPEKLVLACFQCNNNRGNSRVE